MLKILPLGLLLSVCSLTACSANPKPELVRTGEGYKVSVKHDGRKVSNPNQNLVHRVSLSKKEFGLFMRDWPKSLQLPFAARVEKDNLGKVSGFRVVRINRSKGLHDLGLKRNDFVTAVGSHHTKSSQDMWLLFKDLGEKKQASLSIVRAGLPHKILYTLADTRTRRGS